VNDPNRMRDRVNPGPRITLGCPIKTTSGILYADDCANRGRGALAVIDYVRLYDGGEKYSRVLLSIRRC
jgi:hypothetical protein